MAWKSHTIQHRKKRAFLAAYSEGGTVTAAAELADIARETHYAWLRIDPVYAAAFRQADEHAADRLEAEARRRAVEGVEESIYHQGKVVGTVQRYSDTLLIFLLKGNKPEKFREHMDMTGASTVDVTVTGSLSVVMQQMIESLDVSTRKSLIEAITHARLSQPVTDN